MGGICDVPGIDAICGVIGDTAAAVVSAPFLWLGQAAGAAAQWLFEAVWGLFETTTVVDITTTGYLSVYNLLFGIAIFVMLVFFFLQLLAGLIRRDSGAWKYATLGLARAVLGSFVAITVITLLLEITDQLTVGLVQAAGETMATVGDKLVGLMVGLTAISIASPGAGVILMIFLAFMGIAGAAIVWFSLLIRKSLILVAVVLAPLAFSGTVWEHTKGWFGKWAGFVIALIISKLVVVVIMLVAVNQLAAPIDFDLASVSDPISGIVLMFIAAFAPYMVYKLVSFIGYDMYQAMSVEQEGKQALNRPIPLPSFPGGGSSAKGVLGNSGGAAPAAAPQAEAGAVAGAEGGAAAGGGAAGAGAAAGPVGAAVAAGAIVVAETAAAGPKVGAAIGGAADAEAGQASAAGGAAPAPWSPAASSGVPAAPPPSAPRQPPAQTPPPPPAPPKGN
ncbi:MAG: conjugal transfer protein TrbL [Microbacteriaceae bacterium]